MGIFSGLFKSRDKPQNSTAGSAYTFYMGGTTSGKPVNERSAMQMTAVYSCVRILAEAVAGLPLHLYRYTESGGKEKAIDHPLYLLLHDEPNPEMSSFVFRETLMTHLLLWGNAYAQVIRNGKGEVVALYPLMPNKMKVDRDERGQLFYTYQHSSDESNTMKGSTVTLKPSDVLHIPGLGFDGLVGYSPIAMAKNAIGMAIACEEYGAKFFANGAAPGGVLEHPGTIKDPQRVRESWQNTFGGSGNANKIAVLEEGINHLRHPPTGRGIDISFCKSGCIAKTYRKTHLFAENHTSRKTHRNPRIQFWLQADAPRYNACTRVHFALGVLLEPTPTLPLILSPDGHRRCNSLVLRLHSAFSFL